jgi:hypothetical protein
MNWFALFPQFVILLSLLQGNQYTITQLGAHTSELVEIFYL